MFKSSSPAGRPRGPGARPDLLLCAVCALAAPVPARALQRLDEFLSAARSANVDARDAALAADEREAEALGALGAALPAASVRGVYTRNEYGAAVALSLAPGAAPTTFTVQPRDQWDLFAELDVPVVDLPAWARARAARRRAGGARAAARATGLEVARQVARAYFALIGNEGLRRAAEESLQASLATLDLARRRLAAGYATHLDVSRAQADVEGTRQDVADAELQAALSSRSLQTLSGTAPVGEIPTLDEDLRDEGPLERWERVPDEQLPALSAAAEAAAGAADDARAAGLAFLPTLTASLVERATNAPSFVAQRSYYAFMLTLGWRLDVATLGAARQRRAQAERQVVAVDRARQDRRDEIHEAWQRVRAGVAKSRAARAQAAAAAVAVDETRARFESGEGTALDLLQAQRDASAARAARIRSDADLAYARALLRIAAGEAPTGGRSS